MKKFKGSGEGLQLVNAAIFTGCTSVAHGLFPAAFDLDISALTGEPRVRRTKKESHKTAGLLSQQRRAPGQNHSPFVSGKARRRMLTSLSL